MAIRTKTTMQMTVEAVCPSHSRADVSVRDLIVAIDEPAARGGTNLGPAPTEAALAALIGCTNVIGHKCADRLGVDIGHLKIRATCDFDRRGVTLAEEIAVPFQRIALTVDASGAAGQADLDRVAADVRRFCPLSKLFREAGTEITEHWITGQI